MRKENRKKVRKWKEKGIEGQGVAKSNRGKNKRQMWEI